MAIDKRFSPFTPNKVISSVEAFGVKAPQSPRTDFRDGAAPAPEQLPAYGAPMLGPAERPVHSALDAVAMAAKASRQAPGQSQDHEALLATRVEMKALTEELAALRSAHLKQGSKLVNALEGILELQDRVATLEGGA